MNLMKKAKTGREMLDSWQELVGDGNIEDIKGVFQVYADKMPDILKRKSSIIRQFHLNEACK